MVAPGRRLPREATRLARSRRGTRRSGSSAREPHERDAVASATTLARPHRGAREPMTPAAAIATARDSERSRPRGDSTEARARSRPSRHAPRPRPRASDPSDDAASRACGTSACVPTVCSCFALAVLGVSRVGGARRPHRAPPGSRERPSYHGTIVSESKRKILVAPAWPYAAGHRHLGHVAGFGVPSDVFARYHRLSGNDVLMVSGTDEHGTPVMVAADREGRSYREVADHYNRSFREDFRRLGLSYDLFSRTTTLNHERVTQDLFRTLYEHGAIVEQTMLVSFSPTTGHTLPDRYIEGTCPICGYPEARGDQCDNCGNQLDPTDLIDPRSRIDGSTPGVPRDEAPVPRPAAVRRPPPRVDRERTTTGARTSRTSRSASSTRSAPARSRATSTGACGSRSTGYAEDENKRIYVWFDAVIGYLSASIEWAALKGEPDAWREWWQNPDAEHYYFQGKDNIVFHTVIWPAMLLGYGEGGEFGAGRGTLKLPDNVVATEYLTMEGKQFSTSRSHSIYVRDFLERYDADALRYYLVAAGPETQDTDFTWAEFVRRNNDELLANWGNLVNRTLTNAHRNFGAVPEPGAAHAEDEALLATVDGGFDAVGAAIEAARFRAALAEAMRLSSQVNQYVSDQAPWALVKTDRDRAATVLYVALRAVDSLKVIFAPFLPAHLAGAPRAARATTAGSPGRSSSARSTRARAARTRCSPATTRRGSAAGRRASCRPAQELREPTPLFRKLDPAVVDEELARMQSSA